jgi:hypothetical protein
MMMPVFTVSAILVTVGTALSFYAWRFAWRRADVEREVEFDWYAAPPTADDIDAEPEPADGAVLVGEDDPDV